LKIRSRCKREPLFFGPEKGKSAVTGLEMNIDTSSSLEKFSSLDRPRKLYCGPKEADSVVIGDGTSRSQHRL
jgi:hypothetical protein